MPVLTDQDIEKLDIEQSFKSGVALPILTDKDIAQVDAAQPKPLTDQDIEKLDIEQQAQSILSSSPTGNIITNLFKGLGSGIEQSLGQSLGSPLIATGESLQKEGVKNRIVGGKNVGPPLAGKAMVKFGKKTEELGTKIRDFFVQNSLKGIEAPDKETMMAEFGKTGYGKKIAFYLGSSMPMMTAAIGVTVATKNPLLGASIFGPQAFGQFYDNARANGVEVDNAIGLSIANSVSQVGLEVIPLGGWLKKGGGLFKRMARGAIQEGLVEEGSQQIVQNSLEGVGWKGKEVNLLDGVVESVIVGTIMGAGMGSIPSSMTTEDLKYETKKRISKSLVLDAQRQGLILEQVKPVIEVICQEIDKVDDNKIADLSGKVVRETVIQDFDFDKASKAIEEQSKVENKPPEVPTGKYISISLSEEDSAILDNIAKDIAGAQPGKRYVTRDEFTGEVIGAGYEPSDYSYIEYWPKGWGQDKFQAIYDNAKKGKVTSKQKNDLEALLEFYKEVRDERAGLAQEGISQSEIDTAEGIGKEEASGIAAAISPEQLRKLSTDDLEKFVDSRYEAGAPQEELDLLETIYDERISEEDLKITEEELGIGEATHQGADLEEQLIGMYHRYANKDQRQGMDVADIVANMRSAIETYGGKKDLTVSQILDAAQSLYENKQKLLARQKAKVKEFPASPFAEQYSKAPLEQLEQRYKELVSKDTRKRTEDDDIEIEILHKEILRREKSPLTGLKEGLSPEQQIEMGEVRIKHYTLPENVDKIIQEGFDTTKPPIHGTGGLEGGARTAKFGKDVLYFTLDEGRWSKAQIYVGEGKGDISNEVYDYENQKWIKEINAYKKVNLKSVEAILKKTAKIFEVNDYFSYALARNNSGIFDGYNHIESVLEYARQNGYDAVHISNKGNWEHPTGEVTKYGEKNWYKQITGNGGNNDYFILNKNAIEIVKPVRGTGGLLSTGGPGALGTSEPVISPAQKQEEFKIYKEVETLIHKYAKRFGERYVPSGAAGALYKDTGNIFIRGANALFTAIHEVMHYIDIKEGISKATLRTTGVSKSGNPIYDPATKLLRKEMTSFYTTNYPGGHKTHKLERRMSEGLARFVELYVYKPTYIKENYPYLYKAILQPGGEFYNTNTLDLIRDSREVIGKYQALSPTDKILSRQMDKERKIKDSFLSLPEKIYTAIVDSLFPIEKLSGKESMTPNDPSLWARFSNNGLSTLVANNIYGNRGYWVMAPNGDFFQKFKFNWKTIVDSVSGETDIFGAWLSARDTMNNYLRLDELTKESEIANATIDPTDVQARKALVDIQKEIISLTRQLKTNGTTRQEAVAAYSEHRVRFREQEEMFDALMQEDLNLLNHPMVQLLNPRLYEEFSNRKGYAPKKREFFYNEILGDQSEYVGNVKVGKTKVSSMLPRKGSELPELNPLYSAILSHAETMKKAVRQMVYNKIFNLAPSWPDVLQVIPLKTAVMPTGEIFFPQEKDPNIIMARENYKRKPVLVAKEIKLVLDATVTYQNVSEIERWMKNASRLFVKGTTANFPLFAFTNFFVDQITAGAQTQTKIKPIISPLKELILRLDKHSLDAGYFQEYLILGGQRQTLVRYLDGSPDEVLRNIQQEKNGLEKALDLVNQGVDIFAIPTQYSEIVTRAAEYIRAIKDGDSQIVALEKAGQVTAPFHHKGKWGTGNVGVSWVSSIPFFNPAIQVLAQYGRSSGLLGYAGIGQKHPTTQRRALFVLALVTGAMIASFEYLRLKGTEEQKDLYKSLSPDELARYLFIPSPNGKNLLRLRMPEQLTAIGTMINMSLANLQMETRYTPGEFVNGSLSWLPEQFDPTNPARMLMSMLPHILIPWVGAVTGKKFYPTVRDIEGPSLKYLPQGERAYPYTSKLAVFLGKKLNLSPAKIDYLIEGYLGRATRMFIGKNVGNPFVRDMYLYSSRQLQDYYDTREANAIEYKNIDEVKDITKRQKIRKIHDKVNEIDDLMSKLRKIELDKNESNDSYMSTLRGKILDRVDTLWEVAR